jgi:tetratricopeptide (TPR) repeat protein
MALKKILPLLVGLSLTMMPQISVAQVVELVEAAQNAQSDFNYEKAETIWQQVIKLQPQDAFAYARLGDALFSQNKDDEGIAAYKQALKLQKNAIIYRDYGERLRDANKLDASVVAYQEAIKLEPKSDDAHSGLGLTYKQQEKYPEAIAQMRQSIAIKPSYDGYQTLGQTLVEAEKYDEGIAAFRQAIALQPEYGWLYNSIAETLIKQGKTKDAIATYRQAIKLDPTSYTSYTSLAEILEFPQAVATLTQYIKEDPKNDIPLQALGYVFTQKKDFANAFKVYQQAITIKPSAENYDLLGSNLLAQNKLEQAANAYRQAVKINPSDYRYVGLAEVLIKQNKFNEAMAMCQKTIEIKTEYDYFRSYETCAAVGFASYQKQGMSSVITMYTQLAKNIPVKNMADLYVSFGNRILNSEKPNKVDAKLAFKEALKLNSRNQAALAQIQDLEAETK